MNRNSKCKIDKLIEGGKRRKRRGSIGNIEELLKWKRDEGEGRESLSSASGIDDIQKRKRDEMEKNKETEDDVFKKSNRTARSPCKSAESIKETVKEEIGLWAEGVGKKVRCVVAQKTTTYINKFYYIINT